MVPVAPIITGITFVFTFHMRCISIVRSLCCCYYYYYHYYYYYYYFIIISSSTTMFAVSVPLISLPVLIENKFQPPEAWSCVILACSYWWWWSACCYRCL